MNRKSLTPWKPTKAQLLAARNQHVPDLAAKNLIVLFAGINPGLYTAAIGHHFGRRLEAKVKRWRPTVVAFVGIGPYRIVSGIKDAPVGLQKAKFGGSHAWVLPNPSGLNAHYQPAALAQLFGDLRLWALAKHKRRRNKRPTPQ